MKIPFSDLLPQPDEEKEELRKKQMENVKVPLSDKFIMVGTAFLWLFLPSIAVLLVIAGLALLLFGAL